MGLWVWVSGVSLWWLLGCGYGFLAVICGYGGCCLPACCDLGECGKKLVCYIKEVCKNTIYKLEYVSSLANYSRMGMLVAYHLPRRPKGWVLVLLLLHVPHLHYQTPPPNIKTTKLKHGPPYAALDSQLKYMPIKLQHGTKFK